MHKIVHLFFSKETLATFKNTTINGQVLLFEEQLTEGTITKNIFSDSFWSERYDFFEKKHQISRVDYFDTRIKPILELENHEDCKEIVLWLDYTKASQVNLIALGAYFAENFSKNTQYSLVCAGAHKGRNELQKLTDYSAEEFSILFNYKAKITFPNLEYLQLCWQAYALKNSDFKFNLFPKKFRYLQHIIN